SFTVESVRPSFVAATRESAGLVAEKVSGALPSRRYERLLVASNATPYRFVMSAFFPQPNLPADNPLTDEGVELGRRLFFDSLLSINNSQSCASCHEPEKAFAESRQFSIGAEGATGTRNAMPLLNLAWKSSFFWDGRA